MTGRGLRSARTLSSLPASVPGWDPALSPLSTSCGTCRHRGLSCTGTGPVSGQRSLLCSFLVCAPGLWCAPAPPHSMSTRLCQTSHVCVRPLPPSQCCGAAPMPARLWAERRASSAWMFLERLLSPPPSSSDSSVLPRPIVDQGTGLPLLSMSELSPSQGHTGRWDSGSRASSPTRKNPKVYFPSRLYPQTGGCPQREAVCSHSCLGSHPSPPPLPHCPGPQTPRLRPQASESLEVTGRVRAAF